MNQDKSDISPHLYQNNDHDVLLRLGLHVDHSILQHDFRAHRHEYTEAFCILGGSASHILGGHSLPLTRGDVFVIKGDTVHAFENVCDLSIINLQFTPELFSHSLTELQAFPGFAELFILEPELRMLGTCTASLRLGSEALGYVEALARFIIQQQKTNNPRLDGVLRMNAAALMSFLAAQYEQHAPSGGAIPLLMSAIRLMSDHLHEPLTLSDIAREACVSPRHLQRLFQTYYHTQPMVYLRHLRLERARSLLQQTGVSVAEAALQCGFADPSYFTRCYRRFFGTPPGAERQKKAP